MISQKSRGWEGGGSILDSENSKWQVLSKFQFSGRGVYSGVVKNSNWQVLSKFQFSGVGGGGGDCGGLFWKKSQFRVNWVFRKKISTTGASYCITDSLSDTT